MINEIKSGMDNLVPMDIAEKNQANEQTGLLTTPLNEALIIDTSTDRRSPSPAPAMGNGCRTATPKGRSFAPRRPISVKIDHSRQTSIESKGI